MAVEQKVYVGDVGTLIKIDMQEDVSGITLQKFYVQKPKAGGGVEIKEWVCTPNGEYLEHTIVVDEIDIAGVYRINPYGKVGSWTGRGHTCEFEVFEVFK